MSNSDPILTIGIPTWNRKAELRECLELVLPQAAAEKDVEVMVCDNHSDDETPTLVEAFREKYPALRCVRHKTNIGADRNFIEVLRQASGTYVWILSDDDFITDGAVRRILDIIRSNAPSYVSVNYIYCDSQRKIVEFQPDRRYMLKTDVPDADINQSFLVRNHWLSFLSCGIYRRELVDFEDLLANREAVPNWIQVYMTAQVLAKGRRGYHSSFDAVLARVGNDRVDSTPFVAYMPEAFMFIFKRFDVDRRVVESVLRGIKESFLSFPSFLAYRARGLSPSPLIVPAHYKIGLLFPRTVLVGIRNVYRMFRSNTAVRLSN